MFLFVICLLLFGFSDAAIDPRSPGYVRAILGRQMLIPCAVEPGIDWDADNVTLENPSTGLKLNHYETFQGRFFTIYDSRSAIWNVERAELSDAGIYKCTVIYDNGESDEKYITVTILESDAGLPWKANGRCGNGYEADGAECDSLGAFPCCSAHGWCGYNAEHCDCEECVDFRVKSTLP